MLRAVSCTFVVNHKTQIRSQSSAPTKDDEDDKDRELLARFFTMSNDEQSVVEGKMDKLQARMLTMCACNSQHGHINDII